METLIGIDKQLLLLLNGSNSTFIDGLAMSLTDAKTWIPLYISLLYIVIRNYLNVRHIVLIVLCAALCVLLAGTIDDEIVKPLVGRLRPTHDTEIGHLVDIVDGYRGGKYGFFSAHAANTFSIAIFFSLLFRNKLLTIALVLWSLTNCWTRIYLGVHYPGDIICGLIWGGSMGTLVYYIYKTIINNHRAASFLSIGKISATHLTQDVYVALAVLMLSVVYCIIRGILF